MEGNIVSNDETVMSGFTSPPGTSLLFSVSRDVMRFSVLYGPIGAMWQRTPLLKTEAHMVIYASDRRGTGTVALCSMLFHSCLLTSEGGGSQLYPHT